MSPPGCPPTAWAIATAVSIVVTLRPHPRPRALHSRSTGPPTVPADHDGARRRRRRAQRSRTGDEAMALARWCEAVARSMRSGSSLTGALDETPPAPIDGLAPDTVASLAVARSAIRRGRPIDPRVAATADDALVLGVLAACTDHGGAAAEPLDRAAAVLRGRAAEAAERSAQSAQARLSARVMTLLPIAVLALLLVTSPSVRSAISTPPGMAALVVGAALNLTGWRWQHRLIARSAA